MKRVHVSAGDVATAGYDVLIQPGLLTHAPALVAQAAPAARYAIISDTNVAPLYGEPLAAALRASGASADVFVHPAGEAHKTRATWLELTDALLAAGVGRDGCVIAVGGGVTGDLAGFVAATCLRGLPFVQVPTSLLAMVDASVGGKTGVDTPHGKNLVGAFHPPLLVLIDPQVLRTLPLEELRSGCAEIVKHGAIADGAYLDDVARSADALLAADAAVLTEIIERSVAIKAAVVSRDPRERGERAALNFGHTLGHALERESGYRVRHGHAVAIGMVLAAQLGEARGITAAGTARRLREVLAAFGLPGRLPDDVAFEALLTAAGSDKKNRAGQRRYVLLRRPGLVATGPAGEWTFELSDEDARTVLAGPGAVSVD